MLIWKIVKEYSFYLFGTRIVAAWPNCLLGGCKRIFPTLIMRSISRLARPSECLRHICSLFICRRPSTRVFPY